MAQKTNVVLFPSRGVGGNRRPPQSAEIVRDVLAIANYLDSIAQQASMSRVFGGLHYRFDGDGGLAIGHAAARLALERRGLE